jgi:nitroimidazol reductase NimA-like FMN-containing flavoprotein (pyridoxamine 5'-phosphate oxidase superfamily)
MKLIRANNRIPTMAKEEIDKFLENKLMLQMSTIDEKGEPNIQPVWFYYNKNREKFLIITSKIYKKIQNLRISQFCIFP